ncbi:hypothetical protein VQ049_13410, partial [Staphylococcus arlettae]|uniref:hypothetical protein n=1 Tax=Staphylococcus arlettae TaxID=29378 RepID=UPI003CED9C42
MKAHGTIQRAQCRESKFVGNNSCNYHFGQAKPFGQCRGILCRDVTLFGFDDSRGINMRRSQDTERD